jgi:hypothetical protein
MPINAAAAIVRGRSTERSRMMPYAIAAGSNPTMIRWLPRAAAKSPHAAYRRQRAGRWPHATSMAITRALNAAARV